MNSLERMRDQIDLLLRTMAASVGLDRQKLGELRLDDEVEGVALGDMLLTLDYTEVRSLAGNSKVERWQIWGPAYEAATRWHPEERYEERVGDLLEWREAPLAFVMAAIRSLAQPAFDGALEADEYAREAAR